MFGYQSPPPFSSPPDAGMGAPLPPAPAGPTPGMNGIPGATGMPPAPYPMPPGPPDPASMKYSTETQQDGTILLRVMSPTGAPGPVIQVIRPHGLGKHGK